jgi:hypothetical protein
MNRILRTGAALGLTVGFVGLSILIALLVDVNQAVHLYSFRFSFLPGPWFGERIAATLSDPSRSCLIVGASTAREGFDPKELERLVPNTAFYNGGTTGGNTSVLEIQAAIVSHYGLHYRCIIVPIHPWLLFTKQDAVPDLTTTEYASQLDLKQLHGLSFAPLQEDSRYRLLETFLVPFMKHASQMNRIIRSTLYGVHTRWIHDNMSRVRYELFTDELRPADDTNYHDSALPRDVILKGLEQNHFYEPKIYGHQQPIISFQRALDMFGHNTDHLFLVRMPDGSLLKLPNQWASASFTGVVSKYIDRLSYIDCSEMFADDFFIDSMHLNSQGRCRLSAHVAARLNEVLWSASRTSSAAAQSSIKSHPTTDLEAACRRSLGPNRQPGF